MGRGLVALYLLVQLLADFLLEAPGGGGEGIADRHVDVRMGMVVGRATVDPQIAAGHFDLDPDAVELALVLVALGRRDHDTATGDALMKALQLAGLLLDAGFDGGRLLDVAESDFDGEGGCFGHEASLDTGTGAWGNQVECPRG